MKVLNKINVDVCKSMCDNIIILSHMFCFDIERKDMDNSSLINILFFIFGGIITGAFFVLGVYYLIKARKEKKYTCKVYGKVVNNIMREEREIDDNNYKTRRYWYALCEYTVGNTKCARQTNVGTFEPKYEIGQTVIIHYNPNNCHESYIEGDNVSSTKAIISFCLGIFFIIFLYIFKKVIF